MLTRLVCRDDSMERDGMTWGAPTCEPCTREIGDKLNSLVEKQPPRPGAFVAVSLELGMLAVFAYHHSLVGLVLALAYSWFSAARWFGEYLIRRD